MALEPVQMERAVLRRRLLISLAVVMVVAVAVTVTGAILGWTLTPPTGFDVNITTDPVGELPF